MPEKFEAGAYVLTATRFLHLSNGEEYTKGQTVELDDANAKRLGEADAIARKGSVKAKLATGELTHDVLTTNASEEALQAQKEAIEARLAELEATRDEREELEAEQVDPNVRAMNIGDRRFAQEQARQQLQEAVEPSDSGGDPEAVSSESGSSKRSRSKK